MFSRGVNSEKKKRISSRKFFKIGHKFWTQLTITQVGQTVTVKWRGKPVFIRRRNEEEIAEGRAVALAELRDPVPEAKITK